MHLLAPPCSLFRSFARSLARSPRPLPGWGSSRSLSVPSFSNATNRIRMTQMNWTRDFHLGPINYGRDFNFISNECRRLRRATMPTTMTTMMTTTTATNFVEAAAVVTAVTLLTEAAGERRLRRRQQQQKQQRGEAEARIPHLTQNAHHSPLKP